RTPPSRSPPNDDAVEGRPHRGSDRAAMKFGIFYEAQLPRPWTPESEHRLFQDMLAQIELADRLGYDYAWVVEHHFLEEYSHMSAPEVFLGAASQRTKKIRLGHGILQLPTSHPIRVAERAAVLDLLSSGRVELGLGEAQGPIELHPFGARVREPLIHRAHEAPGQARRLPGESEHRDGVGLHVRGHGRDSARESGGLDVLRLLPLPLWPSRHSASRPGQHVGGLPGVAH